MRAMLRRVGDCISTQRVVPLLRRCTPTNYRLGPKISFRLRVPMPLSIQAPHLPTMTSKKNTSIASFYIPLARFGGRQASILPPPIYVAFRLCGEHYDDRSVELDETGSSCGPHSVRRITWGFPPLQ